jgi:hypothetical protein
MPLSSRAESSICTQLKILQLVSWTFEYLTDLGPSIREPKILFGLDQAYMRLGFEFGITDRLMAGFRTIQREQRSGWFSQIQNTQTKFRTAKHADKHVILFIDGHSHDRMGTSRA